MGIPNGLLWSSFAAVSVLLFPEFMPFRATALAGPTASQIIPNNNFMNAAENAWNESMLGNGKYQIRGGWVYADAEDPTKLIIRPADKCRSNPGTVADVEKDPERVEIYLDYPENDQSSPPAPAGYKVVADFHVHPFPGVYQEPEDPDEYIRAYNRDVPGILFSCEGIFYYGPDRRSTMAGPIGYPGNCFMYKEVTQDHIYGPNPFCQK
eukprot:Gb_21249 [translate_table: standard]